MSQPTAYSETQRFARINHRIPCDLQVAQERYTCLVTDLSANGFYVRAAKRPQVGSEGRLLLHHPEREMELIVRVVREHRGSRHHTTGIPPGMGLHVLSAPEDFFQLVAELSA